MGSLFYFHRGVCKTETGRRSYGWLSTKQAYEAKVESIRLHRNGSDPLYFFFELLFDFFHFQGRMVIQSNLRALL
jgi:hypothetical protein